MIFRGRAAGRPGGDPIRLHIGSGSHHLDGWINIDNLNYPGVDRVLDVRRGLPFKNVQCIYAEHFLEHLTLPEGLAFLAACRGALRADGVLRLSTPNLDWVWATHYVVDGNRDRQERLADCFRANRAFRGWGHQFLYNEAMVAGSLRASGFADIETCRYGSSRHPFLVGVEGHETYEDTATMPHVIVVEASGTCPPSPLPQELIGEYLRDVAVS